MLHKDNESHLIDSWKNTNLQFNKEFYDVEYWKSLI